MDPPWNSQVSGRSLTPNGKHLKQAALDAEGWRHGERASPVLPQWGLGAVHRLRGSLPVKSDRGRICDLMRHLRITLGGHFGEHLTSYLKKYQFGEACLYCQETLDQRLYRGFLDGHPVTNQMLASLPQGELLASTHPPLALRPGCQGVMNVLSAGLQCSAATVQAAGIAKHDQTAGRQPSVEGGLKGGSEPRAASAVVRRALGARGEWNFELGEIKHPRKLLTNPPVGGNSSRLEVEH